MSKYNCIGTVSRMWGKQFPDYWVNSWGDLKDFNSRYLCKPDEYIKYGKASVSWHESARNELVSSAEGQWLFMLDTDHTFSPDILERLLHFKKKYNCRVISGIYQYKFKPHAPVLNVWNEDGNLVPVLELPNPCPEVLQVGSVGGGCLLVDRSVYREIYDKWGCNPFDIITGLSEDYSFCWRCKELNIPVFCSPVVECHHVIDHVLSIKDYKVMDESIMVKVEDGKVKQ